MRTFAQKQKTAQATKSASSARPGKVFSGQSREVSIILHLQRTIGNQAVQRLLQASAEDLNVESATTTSTRFAYDFSPIPLRAKTHAEIQPKLAISAPGNIYEQEADRVADQVMSMPEPVALGREEGNASSRTTDQLVQHKPAIGGGVAVSQELNPQTQSPRSNQPLSSQEKAFFEPRFGHDFSRVRVHADEQAALRADALRAQAFTVGEDIFFSRGAYRPGDGGGRNLLAHELAHVMQQTGARGRAHTGVLSHSLLRAPAGQVQPKLVATGDGAGFASVANTVIAVQFSVSVAANGEVALNSTNVQGPLTADAQELVSVLRNAIGNASTTTIRFIRGQTSTDASDARVFVGSYPQSKIDLDDVLALGIHTSGYNAGAALAHEISEEFEKQVNKAAFNPAHATALAAEARAVGATRIADSSRVINSTTLEFTFSYRYPDGRILDQVLTVTNGNITNVVRTWRP
jgi:hypothetical protein